MESTRKEKKMKYENIAFSLSEKNSFIVSKQVIFNGKKRSRFSYQYPKKSFIIYKNTDHFLQVTLETKNLTISLESINTLSKRVTEWFLKNNRHLAVVVSWKKVEK